VVKGKKNMLNTSVGLKGDRDGREMFTGLWEGHRNISDMPFGL